MTKKYNPKDRLFVYIFDKKSIYTSYRDLAEILEIPLGTLHRLAKELEEEGKIKTVTEDNLTCFEVSGFDKQTTIFDFPISSDPITFTSRQHKLIDFLKEEFTKNPNRFVGKMEVLFALKNLYFAYEKVFELEQDWENTNDAYVPEVTFKVYFESTLGERRYNIKEYADLTKDIQFINEHCDVRQVLIINRAGKNGGIKIAKKSEGFAYIKREFINTLARLKRVHIKRKFLEKDGNYRLVLAEEKEILEILK